MMEFLVCDPMCCTLICTHCQIIFNSTWNTEHRSCKNLNILRIKANITSNSAKLQPLQMGKIFSGPSK